VALGLDKGSKKHILGLWQGSLRTLLYARASLRTCPGEDWTPRRIICLCLMDLSAEVGCCKDVRQQCGCTEMSAAQAEKRACSSSQGASARHTKWPIMMLQKIFGNQWWGILRNSIRARQAHCGRTRGDVDCTQTWSYGAFRKALQTTNPIESASPYQRRSPAGSNGGEAMTWCSGGSGFLLRAENKIRCVKGHKKIPNSSLHCSWDPLTERRLLHNICNRVLSTSTQKGTTSRIDEHGL